MSGGLVQLEVSRSPGFSLLQLQDGNEADLSPRSGFDLIPAAPGRLGVNASTPNRGRVRSRPGSRPVYSQCKADGDRVCTGFALGLHRLCMRSSPYLGSPSPSRLPPFAAESPCTASMRNPFALGILRSLIRPTGAVISEESSGGMVCSQPLITTRRSDPEQPRTTSDGRRGTSKV
jgi:hypothetical protein